MDLLNSLPSLSQICKLTAPIGWVGPIPQFYSSYSTKNTSQLPNLTFHFATFTQIAWFIYATKLNYETLIFTTKVGFFIFFIYANLVFIMKSQKIKILYYIIILIAEYAFLDFQSEDFIGTVAFSVQFIGAFMNAELLVNSWKKKSNEIFTLSSLLIAVSMSLLWFAYAIQLKDLFVFLPTAAETLMNILQMIFFIIFPNKLKTKTEKVQ